MSEANVVDCAAPTSRGTRPTKILFRASVICGLAPLAIGVLIFLAWLPTRAAWLEGAGVLTIVAGVCVVAVGGLCLLSYAIAACIFRTEPGGRIALKTLGALLLLGINFPAAGGLFMASVKIKTNSTVLIENAMGQTIEEIEVRGSGLRATAGVLAPGESRTRMFGVEGDGALSLTARRGDMSISVELEPYVTRGTGVHKHVIFRADGSVDVSDRSP